ncbi:hypothetical protein CYMTET_6546 [Cymbomonas tetramitiformis]|uniref:Uncharacterized protein n=1 Tax=Cymbomonas tetramitiformis TaxID=36881 RepID=A0AAE0LHS9_9CHLO|nr:hypothetical protein CYMTET_6546 [Cymbomonas tetramitiformis]
MRSKRYGCEAVVQGQHIYAVGGYDESRCLETGGAFGHGHGTVGGSASHAQATLGQHIYAVGGNDGTRCLETVERLNTATGQWEAVPGMLYRDADALVRGGEQLDWCVAQHWCVVVILRRDWREHSDQCDSDASGQHIYAMGGYDGVRHLETGQHIYALGGNDGIRHLETVERLDTATGQWEAVPCMRTKRRWLGQHIYAVGGSVDWSIGVCTVERRRLLTREVMSNSSPSLVFLADLDKLYHQLRGLRPSVAPRQRLPSHALQLLELLQCHQELVPLLEGTSLPLINSALDEGETLHSMLERWRAAQRAVRNVAVVECSLHQDCSSTALQEAARQRDGVRQQYTGALQEVLQQWEARRSAHTITDRITWLQEQVGSWRAAMGLTGETSREHASNNIAIPGVLVRGR